MLLAVSMLAIVAGCASNPAGGALTKEIIAAEKRRPNLPPAPADCRSAEPVPVVNVGDNAKMLLARTRLAAARANARLARCARFYDSVKREFGAG